MLLLDTHAFLWFMSDPSRLSEKVNTELENADVVYISVASFWEMAITSSLGKLKLPTSISDMMKDCEKLDFSVLPIRGSHLERLQGLPWHHRDPFDRLLICQAQEEHLTMVTVDENIVKYDLATIW